MNVVDKATETQIQNIQTRTGKTLDELFALIRESGLSKHGEIREMLKRDLSLGYGDANALAAAFLKSASQAAASAAEAATDDVVGAIYAGAKGDLRPIHEKLMAAIAALGPFEIAPKKAYVSLRRKKQFATIGPATKTRVDVGLNMKGVPATERLIELPPGGMCQYRVSLTDVSEVDQEVMGWVRSAYEGAG
jgi:predicted transport protein